MVGKIWRRTVRRVAMHENHAAFFDGHVTLLSTEPYTLAGTANSALSVNKKEVIFWLHDQF